MNYSNKLKEYLDTQKEMTANTKRNYISSFNSLQKLFNTDNIDYIKTPKPTSEKIKEEYPKENVLSTKMIRIQPFESDYFGKYPFGGSFQKSIQQLTTWTTIRDPKRLFQDFIGSKDFAKELFDTEKGGFNIGSVSSMDYLSQDVVVVVGFGFRNGCH